MRELTRGRAWWLLVLVLSLIPVAGLFTTSRLFFIRDLSFFFWSRHLWVRQTLLSGHAPWWDPYVAGGQSAIADALNQLLMPVALAIRLLPSDVVSFNLWVALPLPIAALGMFVFLKRQVPSAAAALGACAFALSGPLVSMPNVPNLAWSVACMPWVMAAGGAGRAARLAVAFGLQGLCGEPVTWAATGALAAAWVAFNPDAVRAGAAAPLLRRIGPLGAGLTLGAALAAAQLVPTFAAGVAAHRAAIATPDFWSLHPLSLWETLAPHLFGNYYDAFLADLPWMGALNFGRDPFFYSIYVGPFVVLLALAGAASDRRRGAFWTACAVACVFAAFGGYTPVYPLVRRLVPALMYFRFPVKYLVFAVFACAVLVARGFASLTEPRPAGDAGGHSRLAVSAGIVAAVGLALSLGAVVAHAATTTAAHALAMSTHLKDPRAGAEFLARVAPPLAVRGCVLLLAGAVLVGSASRHRRAAWILFGVTIIDLLLTNGGLNVTLDARKLAPPAWYTALAADTRVYVGGRVRGYMNGNDPDGVSTWQIPAEGTAVEGRMELNALLPMAPSGWRVREALSYDLPYLWPADYERVVRRFERASPAERDAFLRRSGVRWCVLPRDPRPEGTPPAGLVVADVGDWNMRVYECHPAATRVFVAPLAAIEAKPGDDVWAGEALFDPSLADDAVRVAAVPAPAGDAGPPQPAAARLIGDGTTAVTVEASLPFAGVLVVRDSYDPSWSADVDGAPAAIVRANRLYRAVALPPGRHLVRFRYRPSPFRDGLNITMAGMAVTGLIALFPFRRRPPPRGPATAAPARAAHGGFTLIELMVVIAILAILLAVAFTQYRGMAARGNEASAVSSIRAIATAEWQFAMTCGNTRYAASLASLGQPVPSTGQAFLSPDLAGANGLEKSGYTFQLAAKAIDGAPPACNGAAVAAGFAATADPARPGRTGASFYGVNADRVLYRDEKETFTGNMGESGPPAHGTEVK